MILTHSMICAQNQYEGKESIKINGTIYNLNWDFSSGIIFQIENANNNLFIDALITKKGDTLSIGQIQKIKLAKEGKDAQIISEVFSREEIMLFKNSLPKNSNPKTYNIDKPFIQYAVVLDGDGNILNIRFRLCRYPDILNNLKPQRIYELEKKFKKELKFIIPHEYREKYKFIPAWYFRVNFDSL